MPKEVAMVDLYPLIRETLQEGREVVLMARGTSMLPLLRHNKDRVCLVQPPPSLQRYDLPLFRRENGQFVLHRIVEVTPAGYRVAGDNQWETEYPILHSQVIGVVKGFWRGNRYIACKAPGYRLYCRFWWFSYPARRLGRRIKQFVKRVL